jgi:Transposase
MAKRRAKTTDRLSMGVSGEHDVGIDPHKKTLTATVLDGRGGTVATASFKVSGVGHRALLEWATSFGAVRRWGIENASGLGRHTAIFLIERGCDVRDVCPTRTAEQSRKRRQGKTDVLDSLRRGGPDDRPEDGHDRSPRPSRCARPPRTNGPAPPPTPAGPDPPAHRGAGPLGQHRPRGDLLGLLRPAAHRTVRPRAAPDPLGPHQAHRPPRDRQIRTWTRRLP